MKLKRQIGFFSTVMYGLGVIIGAGIYSLIGTGASITQDMLWLSFLFGGLIALCSGSSYAYLSSLYPKESAEYTYVLKTFSNRDLAFISGWLRFLATVFAAVTVSLGFAGYLSIFIDVPKQIIAIFLILFLMIINLFGTKFFEYINDFLTILSLIGLCLVIGVGIFTEPFSNFDPLKLPKNGLSDIFFAVSIIFFAYTGFESIPNISEEVRKAKKTVPKAIFYSILISSIFYILVAFFTLRAVGFEALSNSSAPLATVMSKVFGSFGPIVSLLGAVSIINTVLIFILSSSRMLASMAEIGEFPKIFSQTNGYFVPHYSIVFCSVVSVILVLFIDLKTSAIIADLGIFLIYLLVNFVMLKINKSHIPAYLGIISIIVILLHFPLIAWLYISILIILGKVIHSHLAYK